jgi:H+/Cl- antiporter ClcA
VEDEAGRGVNDERPRPERRSTAGQDPVEQRDRVSVEPEARVVPDASAQAPSEAGTPRPSGAVGKDGTAMLPEAPAAVARHQLRLVLLGAVIGLPAALLAVGFLALVHAVEDWLWTDVPVALGAAAPPWYLVAGLPVVGAAVVLAARKLLPGDGGHSPLDGMSTTPAPLRYVPGVALAALGTLAFGAVLGPEAPLIAIGGAVGTAVAAIARLRPREAALLTAAGSFSAISALFGGPLVASFMLIEGGVAMGAALVRALLPGLVAAAIGYLVFIGIGSWGGVASAGFSVQGLPGYDGTSVRDLLVAVLVGVTAALVIAPVQRLAAAVAARSQQIGVAVPLLLGGVVVGVLALVVRALGGNSQDLLFSGQSALPALAAESSIGMIVVLLVAKAIGYGVCLGCGFRGGPVFPPIFLGIAVAMIAAIVLDLSPTLAVAVGAAAGMAGATGLLFSPVLFAVLLVGTDKLDVVSAAVLASVAAWLTATALKQRRKAADASS